MIGVICLAGFFATGFAFIGKRKDNGKVSMDF